MKHYILNTSFNRRSAFTSIKMNICFGYAEPRHGDENAGI